ncbi:MAG: GHKL domain-containing protein [Selenomonadaceae bacterium]|nr:GHKL domain-containing protein [Selenomonadaceae bacterium]MDD6120120.1 GHKL domain-containing protein [Selenomonadaceae bacterium]MDD7055766.1 GHKL domain-containing protein [Selenomonadaceae bacterium]MDY3916814.1 GHKL domain-containing protein [Selenomonadaceae bacterium]
MQALPHSMGWIRVTTKKIGPWFTVAIDNNYDAQSLRPRGANYLSGKYGYLGTGIGLSSVQEVVARYGGHLDIRAAHGVFSVSCRLRAASPQPA